MLYRANGSSEQPDIQRFNYSKDCQVLKMELDQGFYESSALSGKYSSLLYKAEYIDTVEYNRAVCVCTLTLFEYVHERVCVCLPWSCRFCSPSSSAWMAAALLSSSNSTGLSATAGGGCCCRGWPAGGTTTTLSLSACRSGSSITTGLTAPSSSPARTLSPVSTSGSGSRTWFWVMAGRFKAGRREEEVERARQRKKEKARDERGDTLVMN